MEKEVTDFHGRPLSPEVKRVYDEMWKDEEPKDKPIDLHHFEGHTEGNWGVEVTAARLWIGPIRPDGQKVDDIVVYIDNEPELKDEVRERNLANARLIAAAPALLAHAKALEAKVEALSVLAKDLWAIIDDIDTYSDMAKSDDKLYRSLVERRQKTRWETGVKTDGCELDFSDIRSGRIRVVGDGMEFNSSPDEVAPSHRRGAVIMGAEKVAVEILVERKRQMDVEGWTPEHDDQHELGELAAAGAYYAFQCSFMYHIPDHYWPWDRSWYKPTNCRRDLIKAAALIIAEIERIDRLEEQ